MSVVDRVLDANPAAVADVRAGKPQAVKFLVGQVMRETRGQAKADAVAAADRATSGVTLNFALWLIGLALVIAGLWRIRAPLAKVAELDQLAENAKRYDSWRGNRTRRRNDRRRRHARDAPPANHHLGRHPGRGRRADRDRFHRPLTARQPKVGRPAARRRRCSMAVQRSITTGNPPSWAMRAASQLTTPSCSHNAPEPVAAAERATGSTASERRKTSTMSKGPPAATASSSVGKAGWPWTSLTFGLTGTQS